MYSHVDYNGPAEVFLISRAWFDNFKEYIQYSSVKGSHVNERDYMESLIEDHLTKKNPGKIINAGLLKSFDKYIRIDDETDSANFVLKRRVANMENVEF